MEEKVARQFDVVIECDDEGFYIAMVPQLLGCDTQARSLDDRLSVLRAGTDKPESARFRPPPSRLRGISPLLGPALSATPASDVSVHVQPVQTLHLHSDVSVQQFRNGRQSEIQRNPEILRSSV